MQVKYVKSWNQSFYTRSKVFSSFEDASSIGHVADKSFLARVRNV